MIIKQEKIFKIVIEAGKICLKYFKNFSLKVSYKNDDSPITLADKEVSDFLKISLLNLFPNFSFLSEEDELWQQQQSVQNVNLIVVDPIDGTSDFIKGSENFTVNICIISNGKPIFSVIYQPITGLLFFADENFSYKISHVLQEKNYIKISNKSRNEKILKVVCTKRKSELNEIKDLIGNRLAKFITITSSIKFCYIAEGNADIYPRMCRIKLWDVAAGFHIAHNAGLKIIGPEKKNLMNVIYNSEYLLEISKDQFFIDKFLVC